MRILSIGNSFSVNAQKYLHTVANLSGSNIDCANLVIGGCPLVRHYQNMLSEEPAYGVNFNGIYTGFRMSLQQALLAQWDVVTLQQASIDSPNPDSYFPYVTELADLIRRYSPKAKIYIHETWAYSQEFTRFESMGCTDQRDMYEKLHAAYAHAAEAINANGILPCGSAFQRLLAKGATKLHSDTAHADPNLGCLTLSATWITALTGKDLRGMDWSALNADVTADEIRMAQEAAYEACQGLN